MTSPRCMRVNQVYRYSRGPSLGLPMVDGYPNYHHLTASVDGVKALLESGINAVREVKAPDGVRRPVIGIRSSPWKAGTETTPWHDVFDLDRNHVRYFGDHKISTPGPLGSTTGNAALLHASELHRGRSRGDRLLAPPVMIFRTVSANGAVKGYVQFCGVAVIERVERVIQSDPQTGLDFPNYMFDLAVIDVSREGEEVDWRWIDDRRDPTRSLEQALRYAPAGWREWVDAGTAVSPQMREVSADPEGSALVDRQVARSEQFEDHLFGLIAQAVCPGQVIKTLGTARPNRIVSIDRNGLRVETEKSVREGREPQLVPAWMVISAWRHLVQHGRLSQAELLNELNVKRSAFVFALLAHFRGVQVGEDKNIVLRSARPSQNDAGGSELAWPTVRESNDPAARPYTATGRAGKVNVRHFRQPVTHAMDVDGLVWSFFPSREEAQVHVVRKIAEGHDAIVVPAKPYIRSEHPLPRPAGRVAKPDAVGAAGQGPWPGSATYASRLNGLFNTGRAADGGPLNSVEVAEALQADGLAVHPDSIDRLRAGTASRPSDQLSFALAFYFDVDPDYFFEGGEIAGAHVSDFELTNSQFIEVLAGLSQTVSRSLDIGIVEQQLVIGLGLIIADAAALMIETTSGTVLVPVSLAERIMTTWEQADPLRNGTQSEFLRAAGLFDAPRC